MKSVNGCVRFGTAVLSVALAASVVIPQWFAVSAAKLPTINKTKTEVKVGGTVTLKLKNVKKKAKVTWSSKAKKIAKITKSTKTSAKIKGVKAGSTTIMAKYKYGKTKKTLRCKVTVNNKDKVKESAVPTNAAAQASPSAAVTATPAAAASSTAATPTPTAEPVADVKWVTTWGTAEEKLGTNSDDINNSAMPKLALADTTIRQIIKVTTSGNKIKFRLSNQYGDSDVVVKSMHIAKQVEADKSTIDTSTDTIVTVKGTEDFDIPAGELIETDGIDFQVDALDNIAVSMYFEAAPARKITGHRGARATTYQVEGNSVSEETLSAPKTTTSWFFLADASLMAPSDGKAVVCFGDSITDGYGTDADYLGRKPDSYTRWGDYFAKRLQKNESTKHVSVINEGIGANSIMGSYPTDAGKDRFERDITQHDGVEYCIILFGVNDLDKLQNTSKFEGLKAEFEKMVATCHKNNIKVYAAPILPFGTSSYYSDASEEVRTMLNDWMRDTAVSGFDGIVDFESAVADPNNPKNVKKEYTHDDGLHPYDGYEAMAEAIDLEMFE